MSELASNDVRIGIDLCSLPEFAPSPNLWARIETAQRVRLQQRRNRTLGGIGLAAAVLAGLALWVPTSMQHTGHDALAGQRESQALEVQWQQIPGKAPLAPGSTMQLHLIDAALQAAYDRSAPADQLTPLWRERNQALRELIGDVQSRSRPDIPDITRI